MRISEAAQKARKQFWLGWAVTVVAVVLLTICMLRIAYEKVHQQKSVLFDHLFRQINNGIAYIYKQIPLIDILWPYIPLPSFDPLLSADNFKLAALLLFFAWGLLMRDSGWHLSRRIAEVRQRAEDRGWERSLTGEIPRPDVLAIKIDLMSRDEWYKRPLGIVLLSVVGGYILALLSKLSDLSG